MHHSHIGTEHLLLGLLREPTIASRILESRGITLEGARQEIAKSGVPADLGPLTPEEAAAERESLRSLIGSLPDDALRRARGMLQHLQMSPGHRPPMPPSIAKLRQRMLDRTGPGSGFLGSGSGSGWKRDQKGRSRKDTFLTAA